MCDFFDVVYPGHDRRTFARFLEMVAESMQWMDTHFPVANKNRSSSRRKTASGCYYITWKKAHEPYVVNVLVRKRSSAERDQLK